LNPTIFIHPNFDDVFIFLLKLIPLLKWTSPTPKQSS